MKSIITIPLWWVVEVVVVAMTVVVVVVVNCGDGGRSGGEG